MKSTPEKLSTYKCPRFPSIYETYIVQEPATTADLWLLACPYYDGYRIDQYVDIFFTHTVPKIMVKYP